MYSIKARFISTHSAHDNLCRLQVKYNQVYFNHSHRLSHQHFISEHNPFSINHSMISHRTGLFPWPITPTLHIWAQPVFSGSQYQLSPHRSVSLFPYTDTQYKSAAHYLFITVSHLTLLVRLYHFLHQHSVPKHSLLPLDHCIATNHTDLFSSSFTPTLRIRSQPGTTGLYYHTSHFRFVRSVYRTEPSIRAQPATPVSQYNMSPYRPICFVSHTVIFHRAHSFISTRQLHIALLRSSPVIIHIVLSHRVESITPESRYHITLHPIPSRFSPSLKPSYLGERSPSLCSHSSTSHLFDLWFFLVISRPSLPRWVEPFKSGAQ